MAHRSIATGWTILLAMALASCGANAPQQAANAPPSAAPATPPPVHQPVELATSTATAAQQPVEPTPTTVPPPSKPVAVNATPKAQPSPAAPAPTPEPVVKSVPAGTELAIALSAGVSSKTNRAGDSVSGSVTKAVTLDGATVVPEGAIVRGKVVEAVPLKKIGGKAILALRFDTLETPVGQLVPIDAELRVEGKSETGKDTGTIAGATAGGALLGRLLSKDGDKTKGTLIGAAVGAAAGTGAAAATKGHDVEFAAGTEIAVALTAPVDVIVTR